MLTLKQFQLQRYGMPQVKEEPKEPRVYTRGADWGGRVIKVLKKSPCTPQQLAGALDCTPRQASQILLKMFDKDLIDREPVVGVKGGNVYAYKVKS